METQLELKNSKEIIEYLAQQFPNCFIAEGDVKPLKIGIFQDLVARLGNDCRISKVKLRSALRTYTLSWRYLASIKEGVHRTDLDGNADDVLTSEHVLHAQEQLKEAKEKARAKRVAANKDKPKKAKPAHKPVHLPKASTSSPSDKKFQPRVNPVDKKTQSQPVKSSPADLTQLKAGDSVQISLSSRPMSAILLKVTKDNVKVKIASGMELTVKPEHIVILDK